MFIKSKHLHLFTFFNNLNKMTMKKNLWLLFLAGATFASCQKEKMTPLHDTTKARVSADVPESQLMTEAQMNEFLSAGVPGYKSGGSVFSSEGNAPQMTKFYTSSDGGKLSISFADMANLSDAVKTDFLAGRAYNLVSATVSPTALLLSANTQYGFEISQFTGMGAVQLATFTGFSNATGLFSTALSTTPGSFVRASSIGTNYDAAGWEVFDSKSQTGMVVLLINSRYALVVDGTNQNATINALMSYASSLNYGSLASGQGTPVTPIVTP